MEYFKYLFPPDILSFTDEYNKRMTSKYNNIKEDISSLRVSIVALMSNYLRYVDMIYKSDEISQKFIHFINGNDESSVLDTEIMHNKCNNYIQFFGICNQFVKLLSVYDKDFQLDDFLIKD